ncbi:hypothetical protein C9374_007014 [Naegleria lovaniensis]|uniref:ABC transporter domain-containing protein n=1 Tax=Naegleria lovaniensis TaxID=51637 RepID=A0AA88GYQ0_NAELO|nr:uncharacterized protein C9374_007014 [Naegleria lovaniensis]KAG2393483.1 hypothetical protein C9374_007014 [Naegleria lovaniensis]
MGSSSAMLTHRFHSGKDHVLFQKLKEHLNSKQPHIHTSRTSHLNTPNTNYVYRGPTASEICVSNLLLGRYIKDLWCEQVNPYSGTPEILADISVMKSSDFSYDCVRQPATLNSSNSTYDDQMDDCYSVVGIRAFDYIGTFVMPGTSYMIEALRNGRIFFINTNIQYILGGATRIYYKPEKFANIIKFDGHAQVTGKGSDAYDHITFAQKSVDSSNLNINGMYNIENQALQLTKTWYYALDPSVTEVLQLKMIRDPTSQNIYSVALVKQNKDSVYQLIFLQPDAIYNNNLATVRKWDIIVPAGNEKIHFDSSIQFGNFSSRAPMRVNAKIFDANNLALARALITIQTDKQVRIFEFSDNSESMAIDFTKNDLLSTFYSAPDFTKITYARLISETVRRPLSLDRFSTCSNIEFPLSQNMFLALGLTQNYDGPDNIIYTMLIHHIHEFSSYNFVKSSSGQTNTVNRPENFACKPTEYVDRNGACASNIESYTRFDNEIISIDSKFMDINETINEVDAYDPGGHLNAPVLCELSYMGPNTPPDKEKCRSMAESVACEIDIFNGGLGDVANLYSFFYSYWQETIFVTKSNSDIEIHAMALDLDPTDTQAYVTLTKLNRFKVLGNIIDLHVSSNNLHMFISVSRQRWEIDALKRYALVCDALAKNPDDLFLKAFKDKCELIPPIPINENQFALVTSACIKGSLCSSFSKHLIRSTSSKGTFVYRSVAEIPCIIGSYCVSGIRIPCPLGYICPDFGMVAPQKCNANYGYQTCYSDSLDTAYTCPNGTLCTTDYLIPIPASPGHFVKKTDYGQGIVVIDGLEKCSEGDYCNLAREAITTPMNGSLSILLCPADTYCVNASILEPSLCSYTNNSMDYCPPGSVSKSLCPAGYYCANPNSIKPCSQTQYCPEGSFTYQLCPEGYYCPNASAKIGCPAGYFCRQGSIEPSPCSWFLSSCPEMSASDRMTYGGLVLVFVLLFLMAVLYFAYEAAFKLYIKMSTRQRKRNPGESSSLFSPKQKSYSTANTGCSSFHEEQFTVDIGFQDLGLVLRGSGKKVLNGVTGEIKHGRLTAVMGLSGAGKSTFITTLSNRAYYGTQVGKVFVNGIEERLSNYNRKIGFVPQDDIMIPTMTVEETLYFSAKTRLDASTPQKQINAIVNDVIKVLRLEDVRHSLIGDQEKRGISGGQRKRVNVGIELVSSPYVLFLDEPTSGLDSASSKEVCEALQAIASCGITVITVIHQPRYEIFNMFDTLLLLGKGGRTIYLGPISRVEEYFEEIGFTKPNGTNLADFVIDVSAGLIQNDTNDFDPSTLPDIWVQKKTKYSDEEPGIAQYLPKDENGTSSQSINSSLPLTGEDSTSCCKTTKSEPPKRPNKFKNPRLPYFSQFFMCFKRSLTQLLRTLPSLVLDYSLIFLCGAFLGLIYYNKVYIGPPPKAVYEMCPNGLQDICSQPLEDPIYSTSSLMTLAMALMGAMSALRAFGGEYLVFYRESQTGLSTFCYFWAKDISLFIVNIFAPVVFLSIYYTTVSPRAPVYEYYYVLLLVYWTSYGLGYFISIIIKPNIAQLTAVVIVFIFNTFSGATTPLPTLKEMYFPINYLPYLSYLTYSHENAYLIELKRYEGMYDLSKSLKIMGYSWDDFYMTIYMMIVYGFIFRIAAFIALVCVKPSSFYNLAVVSTINFFQTKVRAIIRMFKRKSKEGDV